MAAFTKLNLVDDVEDLAPRHGMAPGLESRFARRPLGLERQGLTLFRLAPGFRFPFGHSHREQEEVYVVLEGGARANVDGEIVGLARLDALRVAPGAVRNLEAGDDGALLLVAGAPVVDGDVELLRGWWAEAAAG